MAGKVLNISLNATITPLQKALESVGKMMTDFAASIEKTDKKMADSIRTNVADMNASLDKVKQSFVNTEKAGDKAGKGGTASLRSQLRQATQEAQNLAASVGTSDPKFIAAAQKAAQLKDELDDANMVINSMNPDEKFKGIATALSGGLKVIAGLQGAMAAFGFESENAQKTMAKLQALMAMAEGLNALGAMKDSLKFLSTQAKLFGQTLKAAIGSTGIGLLLVAVGTLAANWDKVISAIDGVSAEHEKLHEQIQKSLKAKQHELELFDAQKAQMLLAGKTEKEILQARMQRINMVIKELSADLALQRQMRDGQIAAAQRNKDITVGMIDMLQKPLKLLLAGIDAIGDAFGAEFELVKKFESFEGSMANLLFDPEEVKNKSDQSIREAELALEKTKSEYAQAQLDIRAIDNKSAEDAKKIHEEKNKKIIEQNEKMQVSMLNKQKEYNLSEQLLREETGMSILEIDRRYAEISEKYKISDSKKVLEIIKKQFDDEKKLQDDMTKAEQQEQMDKANRMQDNLNEVKKDYDIRVDLATKKGLTLVQIDEQFEQMRLNNAKLTNEEIYALIDKGNQDIYSSLQLTTDASKALNDSLKTVASEGIISFAEAMGQAFAGNLDGAAGFMSKLVDIVISTASALGKAFIGMGLASYQVQTSLFQGPQGALKAVAAGAALIAASALAKQIVTNMGAKKMEQGGLVYGNSFVNVGEYGNAHTNPEVIAPLSKLKDLIGGNGTQKVIVEGRLYGSQLTLASNRSQSVINRVTGRR